MMEKLKNKILLFSFFILVIAVDYLYIVLSEKHFMISIEYAETIARGAIIGIFVVISITFLKVLKEKPQGMKNGK